MGLAESLSKLEKTPVCKMGEIISGLEPETRQLLERVMSGNASTRSIADALNKEGYKIGKTSVGLHRTNQCSCPRSEDEPI